MKIEVNTQSSIKLIGEKTIYFDPYLINNNYNDADYIFITHSHYDHFSLIDIKKVINNKTKLFVTEDIFNEIKNNFNNDVIMVHPYSKYNDDYVSMEAIPAYNINKPYHLKEYNWVGYVIKVDKIYYIAGDTDITMENSNIKCDIAFIPIGGKYTMDYIEASKLVNKIKPKEVIPIHYGTIVGERALGNSFKELLDKNINCNLYL